MKGSSKGIAAGMLSSLRGGEGSLVVSWFVFFLLCLLERSNRVQTAMVTPKSSGVKGGRELLRYHPSS